MNKVDIILLIILGSSLLLGAIIFFLSGIYKVKKDTAMVIERVGQFYKVYEQGTYFLMPLVYKRKGVYTLKELEKDIHIEGLRDMLLIYQVIDVYKYHYYNGDVETCIKETYENNPEMSEEILISSLKEIGIKYIAIKAK